MGRTNVKKESFKKSQDDGKSREVLVVSSPKPTLVHREQQQPPSHRSGSSETKLSCEVSNGKNRKRSSIKYSKIHGAIYGHESQAANNVQEENKRMAKRILAVVNRPSNFPSLSLEHDRHMMNVQASVERLRQQEADSIYEENLRLFNRISRVKPSKSIDRKCLEKSYKDSRNYMKKLCTPWTSQPAMTPNLAIKTAWNDRWQEKS